MGLADIARRFPIARFVKFGVVGGSGVVVNYGVYLPLLYWVGVPFEGALAAGIGVSIFTNFLLNEAWTFRDRRTGGRAGFLRRLLQFYFVSLIGAAIQWGVSVALFRYAGLHHMLSVLFGIGVATGWNFFLNLLWTWRKAGGAPTPPAA